jgi:hypothetical protein
MRREWVTRARACRLVHAACPHAPDVACASRHWIFAATRCQPPRHPYCAPVVAQCLENRLPNSAIPMKLPPLSALREPTTPSSLLPLPLMKPLLHSLLWPPSSLKLLCSTHSRVHSHTWPSPPPHSVGDRAKAVPPPLSRRRPPPEASPSPTLPPIEPR